MAACTKLSNFLIKNKLNKVIFNYNIFSQQPSRNYFNCLGEKRFKVPSFNRKKPRLQPRANDKIIWPDAASVRERGFLRPQKEYIPPSDIENQLNELSLEIVGTIEKSIKFKDDLTKYLFLNACYKQFNHKVPSSLLNQMSTLDDVFNFYASPVDIRTPLDQMKTRTDLPPNLHVLYEYKRFHSDDDNIFNGITAFPESNTVVTGLKYKKKYKSYIAPRPKPVYEDEFTL